MHTEISELKRMRKKHTYTKRQTHTLTPRGDGGQTGVIVSSSRSREHIDFSHTPLSTHLPLILAPYSLLLLIFFFPSLFFLILVLFSKLFSLKTPVTPFKLICSVLRLCCS
ncbi:hypothetical protein ILYODFUR_035238 [Ilyodon furcidens]|uniref:Transmembrane protein n=1 Tax=Ilyodon furcidens TaxID=33524 RepID=A0ABV0UDZ7_9TELE